MVWSRWGCVCILAVVVLVCVLAFVCTVLCLSSLSVVACVLSWVEIWGLAAAGASSNLCSDAVALLSK